MGTTIADSGFKSWTPERLPDLAGKTYLITGGNAGIGLEAAKMLARANADVVIAGRAPAKVEKAVAEVDAIGPGATASVTLDLSSMRSVRAAAEEVRGRYEKLDALINNAGIMQTPQTTTEDGFELQLGTNHLGHFLLGGLILDLVEKAAGRIVVVSSIAHKRGKMHFDDLMLTKNYSPTVAYCQSKLANLLFAFELDRKLKAAGSAASCIACHPGYSNTQLQSTGPVGLWNKVYKLTNALLAQPAYNGAIPTVLAAAGTEARAGAYYGPTGFLDARGPVGDAKVEPQALDEAAATRLWAESEKLTGCAWAV